MREKIWTAGRKLQWTRPAGPERNRRLARRKVPEPDEWWAVEVGLGLAATTGMDWI
jgi:hypothetical protein